MYRFLKKFFVVLGRQIAKLIASLIPGVIVMIITFLWISLGMYFAHLAETMLGFSESASAILGVVGALILPGLLLWVFSIAYSAREEIEIENRKLQKEIEKLYD